MATTSEEKWKRVEAPIYHPPANLCRTVWRVLYKMLKKAVTCKIGREIFAHANRSS